LGPRGSAPRRTAVTVVDQCLSSGSNFAVGIVVARIAGPAGLGAYSIAYAVWLVVAASHRSVITDPMAIENDGRQTDSTARLQTGLAAEIALGTVLAGLIALASLAVIGFGQRDVGIALLALAPFVPFLLVQDYWRWAGFMQAKPGRSLANDTMFNCVQAAALVIVIVGGVRSTPAVIAAWGLGAIAGSFYGLRQFSVRIQTHGGYAMVASRWHMSKWLLATDMSTWGRTQAYPLIAAPFIGSVGLGGLKAAQSLVSGPTNVLVQAGGSVGLPEASHGFEHDGWPKLQQVARWLTLLSVLTVGMVAIIVFAAGGRLMGWIYGSEFVQYASTAKIVSLSWLVGTLAGGSVLILKVTKHTRELFNIGLVALAVLFVSIVVLSAPFGVNGTAWAMVVMAVVSVTMQLRARHRVAREIAAELAAS
jgi:O-antigen/teichoic acid export membrane protein